MPEGYGQTTLCRRRCTRCGPATGRSLLEAFGAPSTGGPQASARARTAANLLRDSIPSSDGRLRFTTELRSRYDNNQASATWRMVKLQQKISGSWRTLSGARNYTAIRSYISTMKKQDHDVLAGLPFCSKAMSGCRAASPGPERSGHTSAEFPHVR